VAQRALPKIFQRSPFFDIGLGQSRDTEPLVRSEFGVVPEAMFTTYQFAGKLEQNSVFFWFTDARSRLVGCSGIDVQLWLLLCLH
jgi:hypothetical protein